MRYVKVIVLGLLTVFALLAGIFTTLLVALVAVAKLVTRRFRPATPPAPSSGTPRRAPQDSQPAAAHRESDVIDVVAHEVPAAPDVTEKLR